LSGYGLPSSGVPPQPGSSYEVIRSCAGPLLSGAATAAIAQDAIPDLKGTWSGKGKSLVFGSNPHHPGSQAADAPPRVDIDVSYVVDGQEGRLAWGRSSSTTAKTDEPFAWAISADNKSIVGADRDGYFRITLLAPDRMDKCYVHNGTSPAAQSSPPATRCGR
jgi:hypothetical protein